MIKRFRMIAGPNGSGKSTLVGLLRRDYAVNFYTMLNADEIFAEVSKTHGTVSMTTVSISSGTPRQAWLNYHDERNMNHKQTEM